MNKKLIFCQIDILSRCFSIKPDILSADSGWRKNCYTSAVLKRKGENNMNIEQFTVKTQEVLQRAQNITLAHQQQQIENAHLLKAMLEEDKDVLSFLLKKNGVNVNQVRQVTDKMVESYPKVSGDTGSIYLSNGAQKTIQKAIGILPEWKDEYVSVEHLLYGMLLAGDDTSNLLKDSGLTEKGLKQAIQELRKGSHVDSPNAENSYQALNRYAKNLNDLARKGKLDPVIGRDEEIRRVLQILCRRTKNNPILIGEPGVGKTAIAEGLAHRIVEGDVPENLKSPPGASAGRSSGSPS